MKRAIVSMLSPALASGLALTLGLALGLTASLAPEAARADAHEKKVTVGHNRLDPGELTVKAGETVAFHNVDEMPGGHTVVSESGEIASPPLDKGQTWSHTFAEPGTYELKIEEHPSATLTVTVVAAEE